MLPVALSVTVKVAADMVPSNSVTETLDSNESITIVEPQPNGSLHKLNIKLEQLEDRLEHWELLKLLWCIKGVIL
jgi:hypothetical protein